MSGKPYCVSIPFLPPCFFKSTGVQSLIKKGNVLLGVFIFIGILWAWYMWVGLRKELEEARKHKKIYVNGFCLNQDISTSHFYQVINGKRKPGLALKQALADFLEVSVEHIDFLIAEGEEKTSEEPKNISQEHIQNTFLTIIKNKLDTKIALYAVLSLAFIAIFTSSLIAFYSDKEELSIKPTENHPKISGDNSSFVEDVTIPDGEIVLSGKPFKKIWRIKNTGVIPWKGRFLTRVNVPDSTDEECYSTEMVPIKDTNPNKEVDIEVYIKTHSQWGSCKTYWKMTDKDKVPFFPNSRPIWSLVKITQDKNKVDMRIYEDIN